MIYHFEQDDGVEVIWSGGPLLPDRATRHDVRWDGLEMHYKDLKGLQTIVLNTKDQNRLYNKSNLQYWGRKGRRKGEGEGQLDANEHRPTCEVGETETQTDGTT